MVLAPLVASIAHSDTITIDGVQHTDVLVSVTPSTYYVKLPEQGTVVSAPKDTIDASTVTFNKDPYYRDALNERFEASKKRAAGGDAGDGASAIGLGLSRTVIEEVLSGTGIEFRESTGEGVGTIVKGATPDGSTSVLLAGQASNLTHIIFQYTVAEDDAVMQQGVLLQIQRISRTAADWILPWVEQNGVNLVQTGHIEKTEAGVHASITRLVEGGIIKFEFAACPEGVAEFTELQKRGLAEQPQEPVIAATSPGADRSFGREARRADGRDGADGSRPRRGNGPGAGRSGPRSTTAGSEEPQRMAQRPASSGSPSRGAEPGTGADFDTSRLSGYQESSTSAGMTQPDMEEVMAILGGLLFVFIGIGVVYYIHFAITLQFMATKTGTELAWLAWIPIVHALLMVRIADKPWWWFLMLISGPVVFIFAVLVGFLAAIVPPFAVVYLIAIILSLILVPFVIVFLILTWIGIAEARDKPGWMGVMTIFPFASFITRTYLAFSE